MCGIVSYVGHKAAKPYLIEGLKRLEYRGYDSAGFVLASETAYDVHRCVGAVAELEKKTANLVGQEHLGLAHTRWATHGAPSEVNAHPHVAPHVVLVHNGILENHRELKNRLVEKGYTFSSQTDTEVLAVFLSDVIDQAIRAQGCGSVSAWIAQQKYSELQAAEWIQSVVRKALGETHGHYAVMFVVKGIYHTIFGVHNGAPLLIAKFESGELMAASDVQAVLPWTQNVAYVEPSTVFCLVSAVAGQVYQIKAWDFKGQERALQFERVEWTAEQAERGGFATFMLKEIMEQDQTLAHALSGRLPIGAGRTFLWDYPKAHHKLFQECERIHLVACGTAYYAAMVAKYWFEQLVQIPVEVDVASEFRYRHPVFLKNAVMGVVSQSGETADTLAALRLAKTHSMGTFSICNVPSSTIAREVDVNYATKAGPEVGVASTKAFTAQLTALASLVLSLAAEKGHRDRAEHGYAELARLPLDMRQLLTRHEEFRRVGAQLASKRTILFVGRDTMYPLALEAALKLKEITYRHAEGYAAGELKHGPLAIVDSDLAVVAFAPKNELWQKTLSNIEEVRSRGAEVIGVGDDRFEALQEISSVFVPMPDFSTILSPILYAVPLQLMSYGLAEHLGRNIDKPRNLAKSVTVE